MWVQGVCLYLTLLYLSPSTCMAAHSENRNSDPTPVMVKQAGYNCETHTVMTPDGYILSLHRIPGRPANRDLHPVFIMHGIMGSSADWVLKGPKQALAYLLADKGYDVWLGNARGNIYSRLHKTLPADDNRYWNFSWHDIGHLDLPVCIDHVLKLTGHPKVHYIGYSMGTTVLMVFLSTRPQYNDKICFAIALAPVCFMKYVTTPIRLLAPGANLIEMLGEDFEAELSKRSPAMEKMQKLTCEMSDFEKDFCENVLFVLCGYSPKEADKNLLPIIMGHTPAGTSVKTPVHYGQNINTGRFQKFDYGPKRNPKVYHSIHPPDYNLECITVPIALVHSNVDKFATPQDVRKLHKILPNPVGLYLVNQTFNHLDFVYGKDAKTLVYDLVIELLKTHEDRCSRGSVRPASNGVRCT